MTSISLWPDQAPYAAGSDDLPKITPYPVHSQSPSAAVIIFPGGGYQMRADHEGAPIAEWLNSLGIAAFVLDYRVAPYKHPVPLLDASRAVRYVRYHAKEWNIDVNRIGILGFSAGGHLASTLGTHFDSGHAGADDPVETVSSRPDAMVLCYPVISFGEYRHHGSMVNLIGENPPEDLRQNLSNELQVTKDTPPAFLWHTADDAAVPVENSLFFAAALSRSQVPFEMHIYPHGRHGLGLALEEPEVKTWTMLCGLWLKKQGF